MLRYHLLLSLFIGFTINCTAPAQHESHLHPFPVSPNGSIVNDLLGEWELTLNYPTEKDRSIFTITNRNGRLVGRMKRVEFIISLEKNYIKWAQEIDYPGKGKVMAHFSGQRQGLNVIKGTVLLKQEGQGDQKLSWAAGRTNI